MRAYEIDAVARAELLAAVERYDDRRAGLGGELFDAVHLVLRRIEHGGEFVTAPVVRLPGAVVRREFVQRFPFLVFFVETETLRKVIAIRHGHADTAGWRSRI